MFGKLETREEKRRPKQIPINPSRRRDKPQLSCTVCRQKKLKCDRLLPCSNCTKRGTPESCDFQKPDSSRLRPARQQGTADVQERVRHLEDMVMSLLNSQNKIDHPHSITTTSPSASTVSGSTQEDGFTVSGAPIYNQKTPKIPKPSLGKLTTETDQVNFVGNEHWEAILEDITELKIDLETPDVSDQVEFKPRLLFSIGHKSRSEIMALIPSRSVCDKLISRWFKTMNMAHLVVHVPTFMKEYNEMFEDPDKTPLMWIGLLFSILGLASYFYAAAGEDFHGMPEHYGSMLEMSRHCCDLTAQCLLEINYLRPRRYTVETLCFYYALDKFQSKDSEFGAYVVLGIIVRVAMRLGYHRDASRYPQISTFDAEMRRRLWSMILTLDLKTSAQIGLPRMIREEETDTAEPKNLLDADFNEDTAELPHPRPITDITPVAYPIFHVRLLRQLGLIVDQTNSITPPSYDEVLRLDTKLIETHSTLPPYFTMRPLSLSITDDPDLILRRYALEGCFQKSRCVLHRKYLIPGKSNSQFQYSRNASIDASMKLLDVQHIFHEGTQPGGQLFGEQWRTPAFINQDYILAAMILCLDIAWGMRAENLSSKFESEVEAIWPIEKRLEAIKRSYDIWRKSSTISSLALKAAETLRVMLKDIESAEPAESAASTSTLDTMNGFDAISHSQLPTFIDQVHSDTADKLNLDTHSPIGVLTTEYFTGMADVDMNFDWELWDSQFQKVPMVAEDFGSFEFQ